MKIGAQLYNLREYCKTTADLEETIKKYAPNLDLSAKSSVTTDNVVKEVETLVVFVLK